MPDTFSFGLEERKSSEPETDPMETPAVVKAEEDSEPVCTHNWEALPKEQQTLDNEGKTIWKCRTCGNKTNTYSWEKP